MSTSNVADLVVFHVVSLSIALIVATNLILCRKKKVKKPKSNVPSASAPATPLPVTTTTENCSEEQMFNAELEAAKKAQQAREEEEIKRATDAELEAALKAQKQRNSQMEKDKAVDFAKPTVMIKMEKPMAAADKPAVAEKPVVAAVTVLPAALPKLATSLSKKKDDPKLAERTVVPTKVVVLPKAGVKTEVVVLQQPKEITMPPLPAAIIEEKPKDSQKDKGSKNVSQEKQAKVATKAKVSKEAAKPVDKTQEKTMEKTVEKLVDKSVVKSNAKIDKPGAKAEKVADKQVDKSKIADKQEDKAGAKQDKAAEKVVKPVDARALLMDAKKVATVSAPAAEKSKKNTKNQLTTMAGTTLIVQSQYIAEEDTGDGKAPAVSMYVKKRK